MSSDASDSKAAKYLLMGERGMALSAARALGAAFSARPRGSGIAISTFFREQESAYANSYEGVATLGVALFDVNLRLAAGRDRRSNEGSARMI